MELIVVQIVPYALIPVAAAAIGAILAVLRPPGPTIRSGVQHFAAGVVFAALSLELLPDFHERSPVTVAIGFGIGIVVMLGLRWLTRRIEESGGGEQGLPVGLLATLGLDFLIDGLILGAGFTAAVSQGILLTLALTLEVLFLGLSATLAMSQAGVRRLWAVATSVGLAMLLLLGGVIGLEIFSRLPDTLFTGFVAFATVALLYLVTEELLVEAHEVPETPLVVALFFVGFLAFLLIDMVS
jgi:ZIP family zinc transporter